MKADLTRTTFELTNHFSRVLMQQGRVQLDADWNEQVSILLHYLQTLAADLMGPHGGPHDNLGFGIVDDPEELKPDEKERLEELGLLPVESGDFLLGKGHYYVDGILCENEDYRPYTNQPDSSPEPLSNGAGLVYLDVWERHITVNEEPDIREVALGGPDTTTRAKVVWQVKFEPSYADDFCPDSGTDAWNAWNNCVNTWQPSNRGYLKARAKLEGDTGLTDPCITPPDARYRGAENQLYRVEIHTGGSLDKATFKWSRDNGSTIFPIRMLKGDVATVEHLGRDSRYSLKIDDWVEIVDDDSVLQSEPGPLYQVKAVDAIDMIVTLKVSDGTEMPIFVVDSAKHPLLRRWDHKAGHPEHEGWHLHEGAIPIEEGTDENNWFTLEDGVQIQFFHEATGDSQSPQYRAGDYWQIPARTETGDVEWPQNSGGEPVAQSPHGVEHHYAPLAIIEIVSGKVQVTEQGHCRRTFVALTQLVPEITEMGFTGRASTAKPKRRARTKKVTKKKSQY